MDHINYIRKCIDHIAKGGKMVFDRRRRGKVMSIEQRIEVQIIDRIEQQVQHCLRTYENDLLEMKLVTLIRDWFFKGFKDKNHLKEEQKESDTMRGHKVAFLMGKMMGTLYDITFHCTDPETKRNLTLLHEHYSQEIENIYYRKDE